MLTFSLRHIVTIRQMLFFSALHGMQARSSNENYVCLSVRPCVRLSKA